MEICNEKTAFSTMMSRRAARRRDRLKGSLHLVDLELAAMRDVVSDKEQSAINLKLTELREQRAARVLTHALATDSADLFQPIYIPHPEATEFRFPEIDFIHIDDDLFYKVIDFGACPKNGKVEKAFQESDVALLGMQFLLKLGNALRQVFFGHRGAPSDASGSRNSNTDRR